MHVSQSSSSSSGHQVTNLNSPDQIDESKISSEHQAKNNSSSKNDAKRSPDDLRQLNNFFSTTIEVQDQEKISSAQLLKELKEVDLVFFEEFKNNEIRILSKIEIQKLIQALKNTTGNYKAAHRAKAAAILGQQLTLSKDNSSILKEILNRQDEDRWVKIQSAIALSHYEPLPYDYIQILLDDIKHPTQPYELAYRDQAALALREQPYFFQIVRSTLEEALHSKDQTTQLKAAIALGGGLPEKGIQILLDVVENKNEQYAWSDRANAIYALHHEVNLPKKVYPVLEVAFKDQNQWLKVEAITGLISFAELSEGQITLLLDTLKNKRYPIAYRSDAAITLKRLMILPEKASFVLKQALNDEDMRLYAAAALGSRVQLSETQIKPLLDIVGNKGGQYILELRLLALSTLGDQTKALSDQAESILKAALRDPNSIIKIQAASTLIQKNVFDKAITALLIDVLRNEQYSSALRTYAAFMLGEEPTTLSMGTQFALELALQDPAWEVKTHAAVALTKRNVFNEEIMSILVAAASNHQYSNWLKSNAIFALNRQPAVALPKSVSSALKVALKNPLSEVKIHAAIALAQKTLALDEVIPVLAEVVSNNQYTDRLRANAAQILGEQPIALSKVTQSALKAAFKDSVSEVKIYTAIALARKNVFDDEIMSILTEVVGHHQYSSLFKSYAAFALGKQSITLSNDAQLALKAALKNPVSEVKIQAAVALAKKALFLNEVLPILVEVVDSHPYTDGLKSNAVFALGQQPTALSDDAQTALRGALQNLNSQIRIQAAIALARKNVFDDEITSLLVEALDNDQYANGLRGNAAFALGEQRTALSDHAQSALKAVLKEPNSIVKIQAAVALARKNIFDDEIDSLLVEVIGNKHSDPLLRGNAAFALGEQLAPLSDDAQTALKETLKEPNSRVKMEAVVALARKNIFDDEIASLLVEVIGNKHSDPLLKSHAAHALGEQPATLSNDAQLALREALKDPIIEVKIQAAVTLARKNIFTNEITALLVEAMSDKYSDPLRRGHAAHLLGKQPAALSKHAQLALREALKDPNSRVKIRAAATLTRKNASDDESIAILVETIGNKHSDPLLRGHVAYVLSLNPRLLKRENVHSAVEAALNDSNKRVKEHTSKAWEDYKRIQQSWLPFLY